ncbi:MAG TPA: cyclic nucleotide-binding domain-containing protein [bacterium]|nr:cyclic nucleotide-binding domain-containing protein [bacterium]
MTLWRARPDKIALLQRVPLFDGLSQKQLAQISRLADDVEVPAGKRLATAGHVGREMFIIVKGEATVRTRQKRAIRLGPGDFVGEMSLLDGGLRSADVEAVTPMRLLVVSFRDFWSLLDAAPSLSRKIMQTLSRRLRDAEGGVSA